MSIRSRRWLALIALSLVIGCGSDQVGALVGQLEHADVESRRAAARTLAERPQRDERAIRALTQAIADSDLEVRRLAIYALGQIGVPAESSVPALKASLKDPEPPLRVAAALAIHKIDGQDPAALPVLIGALRSGDRRLMLEIGALGEKAAWAVPTFITLLSHESAHVRALAAQTLGRIGPAARDAKPALKRSLRDPNAAVQDAAQAALQLVNGDEANFVQQP